MAALPRPHDAPLPQSFFLAELGTTGSVDGNDRFLMKGAWGWVGYWEEEEPLAAAPLLPPPPAPAGKYQPKYVETLLRKYIAEYVTCAMCKSLDTELTRDPISRLYFTTCKACGSQRSVAAIKAGYHATGKGERRKARDAEG